MFIGIDLSLTGTGIVILNEDGTIEKQELYKTTSKEEIEDRLIKITDYVLNICKSYDKPIIYIEGLGDPTCSMRDESNNTI